MHRKAQGVAARVSQKHVHPHVVSPSINLFLSFECLYLLFILFISLSWSSSSMWSEPPSTKITAHPQNEEYCPVAIHNPLTPGHHTFALVGSGARVFVAEVQACTDGLQVVSIESAVSANDSFASSTCNFNISTLDHMKKLRYNAFVRNIEHFGTRSTEGLEGMKVDNIEPQVDPFVFPVGLSISSRKSSARKWRDRTFFHSERSSRFNRHNDNEIDLAAPLPLGMRCLLSGASTVREREWLCVIQKYTATDALNFAEAPGPSGDRGRWP